MMQPADYTQWEHAEILRSDVDAKQASQATLLIGSKIARRYDNPGAGTIYPLEYLYHLAGNVRGLHVLDLGCGSGSNTVLLAMRGAMVAGLDISAALARLAGERARLNQVEHAATFVVGSGHQLPFPSESFDLIVGVAILHHLDLESAARELWRVLRPGGRALFKEPFRNSPLMRRARAAIPYRRADVSPFERPLVDADLQPFARRFSAGRSRPFSLPHVNMSRLLPGIRNHLHAVYQFDAALLRRFPPLQRFASVRVFELIKVSVS
jgi:ubiquinone/menaquinone biosynthesis C-methylase UbiE